MYLNRELTIPLIELSFWILLAICLPLFSGMIGGLSQILIVFYLFASFLIGDLVIQRNKILKEMPSLIYTGIKVLIGATLFGVLFVFTSSKYVVVSLALISLLSSAKNVRISIDNSKWKEILTILPLFIFLFSPTEFMLSTTKLIGMEWDYCYYTSIVESLKKNQDFSNAIFQTGIGINYQAITFLVPAQIALFANITSQIALWGIFMNFLSVLSFGTLSWVILLLSKEVIGLEFKRKYLVVTSISILLVFLGPIHIMNLISLNFKEVLFLGLGYLLPLGSPGFAYSIFWSVLLIFMVLKVDKPSINELILAIFFFVLVAGSKVAMWAPVICFLGLYSIFSLMNRNSNFSIKWLYTCIVGGILSLALIYVLMLQVNSPTVMKFQLKGQNTIELVELCNKFGLNLSSFTLSIFVGFALRVFFFIGPKLLLVYVVRVKNRITLTNQPLILSISITFLFFSFIYLFLNSFALNLDGSLYRDMTFDNGQYLRTVFFIINIFVLVHLISIFRNRNIVLISGVTIWATFCAYSFYHLNLKHRVIISKSMSSWYSEVETDFHQIQPKKMSMLSDGYYSGLGLTAMGITPWYIFGTKEIRDGYSNDFKSLKRRELMIQFFDRKNSISYRNRIKKQLLNSGVDYIVASPSSIEKIKFAQRDNLICKASNSKWFYKL